MKLPKQVKISKSLFNEICWTAPETTKKIYHGWGGYTIDESTTALFLAGCNGKGVYSGYQYLKTSGHGCAFTPSIAASEMAKAYVGLIKMGLTPGAIVQLYPSSRRLPRTAFWPHYYGNEAALKEGRIFIRIQSGHDPVGLITLGHHKDPKLIPVKVV